MEYSCPEDSANWRAKNANILLLLPLILGFIACTAQKNWNAGTDGPTRYLIYFLAIIVFLIISYISAEISRSAISYVLILSAIAQMLVIGNCGFLMYTGTSPKSHNSAATLVLEYVPQLYSPPFDIFYERTLDTGGYPKEFPVIYRNTGGKITKALCNEKDMEALFSISEPTADGRERIREKYDKKKGRKLFYINNPYKYQSPEFSVRHAVNSDILML